MSYSAARSNKVSFPLLLQGTDKTCLSSETQLTQDADVESHGLIDCQKEEDEEEEEEYEVEQIDLIRASVSLEDMAKLITVEEVCILHILVYCCVILLLGASLTTSDMQQQIKISAII